MKKEKQLKSAQLTSHQQKEEALRTKLLACLEDYCRSMGGSGGVGIGSTGAPSPHAKLHELIQLATDILTHIWHKSSLQAAKTYYTSENMPMYQNQQQHQQQHHQHGQAASAGPLRDLTGGGGSSMRTSMGSTTGSFLRGVSPGRSSSPNRQFNSENQHMYMNTNNINNMKSNNSSNNNNNNNNNTQPNRMNQKVSSPGRGSGGGGVEDSARGLHERLRKAQLAFASMKESVDE